MAASDSLCKREDYVRLRKGERLSGQLVFVERLKNSLGITRLGITVTKRFGKAHERNRAKRIIREAFRACRDELPEGWDLVVRPKPDTHSVKSPEIAKDLLKIF